MGDVASVFARTATRVNEIEVEDCAVASLVMESGALASLAATLGSAKEISRLRLCFEHVTFESSLAPYAPGDDPWQIIATSPEAEARIATALEGCHIRAIALRRIDGGLSSGAGHRRAVAGDADGRAAFAGADHGAVSRRGNRHGGGAADRQGASEIWRLAPGSGDRAFTMTLKKLLTQSVVGSPSSR